MFFSIYFAITVEPRFIRTPRVLTDSFSHRNPYIFSKFNQLYRDTPFILTLSTAPSVSVLIGFDNLVPRVLSYPSLRSERRQEFDCARAKSIVRYTEDFVLWGFVVSRFHCMGKTTDRKINTAFTISYYSFGFYLQFNFCVIFFFHGSWWKPQTSLEVRTPEQKMPDGRPGWINPFSAS